MNLETAFFDLAMEIRKLQFMKNHDVLKAARIFENALKKADEIDKGYIIDMFYDELSKVKYGLLGLKSSEGRAFHDRIFLKLLQLPRHMPNKVTLLFQEFIKGVTYFEYQKNNANDIPIYHRLYSCGDGTELYRNDNMICAVGLSRVERNRRKKLIERCYIERLIYDALYRHETLEFPVSGSDDHSQDKGHLFRLDITKKDYETCFKRCQVNVEIEWVDGMPVGITIIRLKNGKETTREIYNRKYCFDGVRNKVYDPIVECRKLVHGSSKQYFKFQTFKKEGDFKLI